MAKEEKDKEIEISIDFSKILNKELFNKANKHKTAISLLLLLGIFYLSLLVRLGTVNEPYLLAADPHTWYRATKFIVEGNIPEKDILRHWPEPPSFNPGLFPYIAAYSFFIANALTGIEYYRFLFWFPAIVTALAVIPAFWIGRELHSNKAGLFSAFFIGMTPSILSRTMAGFFDTDCTNILLSLLTVAFFLSAYNRTDGNNLKKKSPLILSILASLSLVAFFFTWGSGAAYIPWIFIGLFALHYIYKTITAKGNGLKEKLKHSYLVFKGPLLVYIVFFVSFICFTFPFQGFEPIEKIIKVTTFFQQAKAEGGIFPNVWVSISEEMSASLNQVVPRVGPPIFLFGFLGFAFLGYLFYRNFGKKSIYPETFFLMAVWILPTLYGSLWAVRFAMLLSIPLSICAGIALGILFDLPIHLLRKSSNKFVNKAAAIFLLILIFGSIFTVYSSYSLAYNSVKGYGTGISKNWADSMNWLKNNTPECTVVATYWDPGYWIAALSERKVIFDGGSQNSLRYTKLSNLNGLDCVEDRHGYVKEINGTKYCITSRIQDMAGVLSTSNETWAAKVLESYMGNCTELYELVSNDLIGKSHWWTYFSHWDPEKGKGQAYDYALFPYQKQQKLLWEEGEALIYGPFMLKVVNENRSQKIIPYVIQGGQYHRVKKVVVVQNGSVFESRYPNASISGTLWVSLDGTPLSLPQGKCVQIRGVVFCISHVNVQNFCYSASEQYALCRPYAIYMNDVIEDSLFTKTFFYNGKGLKYFEPSYVENPEVKLFRLNIEKFREDLKAGKI